VGNKLSAERLKQAAAKGDESVMNQIGYRYHIDDGVAQDYGKAREWYE
jgi:TPR repeat protein